MKTTNTIIAVGSIALDSLKTINGNRENLLGGSATYFSIAASLNAKVKIVGVVGEDFPKQGWDIFQSKDINTENILIEKGSTFKWGGKYSDDYSKRETLFTELGVFENFNPTIANIDRQSPFIFLGNIQPSLQLSVAKLVASSEYIVTDTMDLWIDLFPDKLTEVLQLSSILLINHEEAEQYTGEKEISNAADSLLALGPKVVVIKQGGEGAYLAQNDHRISIPVFPVKKVIDPTGAGDSFAGGFMGYLSQAENPNFLEAVIMGSATASFCVEGFGVESLLKINRKNLENRINTIKRLMLNQD